MTRRVPHDDLFLYEEALRRGHSVLIATTEDRKQTAAVRREFRAAGGNPEGLQWHFERPYTKGAARGAARWLHRKEKRRHGRKHKWTKGSNREPAAA